MQTASENESFVVWIKSLPRPSIVLTNMPHVTSLTPNVSFDTSQLHLLSQPFTITIPANFNNSVRFAHLFGNDTEKKGPVCLGEFSNNPDKCIRVLECRHALCSDCLEAWAVHCTKAHLNPSRFGITRAGRVVSWTPGPKCPLCCARLNCVPKEDLREAIIAAVNHRGTALSTIIAYQSRSSGDDDFEQPAAWRGAVASASHSQ